MPRFSRDLRAPSRIIPYASHNRCDAGLHRVLLRYDAPSGKVSRATLLATFLMMTTATFSQAHAETMNGALAKAYAGNPTLNVQRASLRATDENVPQALAGYRPTVNASASASVARTQTRYPGSRATETLYPSSFGIQIDQNIFDGNRTRSSVRAAEAQVLGGREQLRNTEQTVLLDGAVAYMNVLRDTAVLNLQRNNVEVLVEQLRQTEDRFGVGEVTRTDVAQAEASLANSRADETVAEANLRTSIATYNQMIGETPRKLGPGTSAERHLPKTLEDAIRVGLAEHPAIIAALHGVDVAEFQVKVVESELYPQLGVSAGVTREFDSSYTRDRVVTSGVVQAQLRVPIYEGGLVYSKTRAAKEQAGQQRLQVDVTRDQVQQAVVSAWANLEASKQRISAAQSAVKANEIALAGTREEAKVGQRTTLDVLNAQQVLLSSRVSLVTAQRDRIVASYEVLQAIGRLSAEMLSLKVARYDASTHFDQVKGKWVGTSTPDGR
ncbi:outer membrane protein [Pseudochelatococcus contaminans]|uniref:Outer membrane protein n=1 Tax=Pseudochelatococcus contaminans TaxID=1538103 RepID=A0A7W5Z200_9HYPH|nr:outer membrane protein [Pseudochelatococcus contaminans]